MSVGNDGMITSKIVSLYILMFCLASLDGRWANEVSDLPIILRYHLIALV